ncbi:MAG: hypothetical protein HF962_05645 [Sulfurovum sp.]|nr:hypothetical protein [Sulfurovum sp.]
MIDKKIGLAVFLILPLCADLSLGQMEVMVEKIKAKRVGSKMEKDSSFVSPFVLIQQDENKSVLEAPKGSDIKFTLGGVINKRAFINERWIKIGEKIDGYELTEMQDNGVTLVQEDRTIKVFLKKSKPIIQINEG